MKAIPTIAEALKGTQKNSFPQCPKMIVHQRLGNLCMHYGQVEKNGGPEPGVVGNILRCDGKDILCGSYITWLKKRKVVRPLKKGEKSSQQLNQEFRFRRKLA